MDIQKEREAYKAALRNLENEFFFATPFDIWLAAKREAQAVPEGFVLLPVEPILEMLKAASKLAPIKAMIEAQEQGHA